MVDSELVRCADVRHSERDHAGGMELSQLLGFVVAVLGVAIVGLSAIVPNLLELPELRRR